MTTNEQYHMYGLCAELLSVSSFKIEHMPHVNLLLNFLLEARSEYERANPTSAEEAGKEDQPETDS